MLDTKTTQFLYVFKYLASDRDGIWWFCILWEEICMKLWSITTQTLSEMNTVHSRLHTSVFLVSSFFYCSGTYYSDLLPTHMRKQRWSAIGPDGRDCGLICWSMWERQRFPEIVRKVRKWAEREGILIAFANERIFARLFTNVGYHIRVNIHIKH